MHQAQLVGLIVMLITIPIIVTKVRWKKAETKEPDTKPEEKAE
jgi:hypothetical protein